MTRRHTLYTLPTGQRLETFSDGSCFRHPRFAHALGTPMARRDLAIALIHVRTFYDRGAIKKELL